MKRGRWVGLFVLAVLPISAHAAVIINEVAWMGTINSANDEWIELYNNGESAISVDGWTLTDGQALTISLLGSIAAGEYAVLERTDDGSAPGTAFLVYTGALPNTGATLKLFDAAGALKDQVAGGENWENIGGDNVTKETAQYTTGGWVTNAPTPGTQNATKSAPQGDETKTVSGGSVIAKPVAREKKFVPSTNELQLEIEIPDVIYVNQPVTFAVVPSNIGETVMRSLSYQWNFGDMSTGSGTTVTHTYLYPGEYLIAVRATYARHDTVVQKTITVLPVRFSMTKNAAGDIHIHNDAPYTIDVSGFTLAGEEQLQFPPLSFIPARGTVTIPKEKLGGTHIGQTQLRDGTNNIVAVVTDVPAAVESVRVAEAPASLAPQVATTKPPSAFAFAPREVEEPAVMNDKPVPDALPTRAAPVAAVVATDALPREAWPMVGLLGVIALGLIGAYTGSQKS